MSYQVLARKYRPKNFETLIGQEHIVRALTHALQQNRLHHAYLFTGTRGVGKTTLSRILAKALNCIGPDGKGGITAQPCGVCDACVAIDAGRFVDYIEMDAASNRGVDEMAQLLEQAVYAPSNARFKVYMIDEVHMLTSHAFNAMLKTLEEPPEHVKFILATTDPQKIPVTVLSRCLQFNLKQMPPGHIIDHLAHTLEQEGIEFETPALRLLAQGAHGSMRDALSLTDQAISYAAGRVTLAAVQGMLGALDQTYLIRVLDALAVNDGAALLAIADEMAQRSLSYSAALQDLASLLHHMALAQIVPAALAEDLPAHDEIVRLAALFDAEEVQLLYQIVLHGRHELGLAPDEYAGFSMTLLRMLAFQPLDGDAPGVSTARGAAAPATAPNRTVPAAAPAAARLSVVAPGTPRVDKVPAPEGMHERRARGPARAAFEAARAASSAAAPAPASKALSPADSVRQVQPAPPQSRPSPPWDQQRSAGAARLLRTDAVPESTVQELPAQREQPVPALELAQTDIPDASAVAATAAVAGVVALAAGASASATTLPAATGQVIDWPELSASLPLRGVAQQLARQSELVRCVADDSGPGLHCHIRIPVDTLLSGGSSDKLAVALGAHFGQPVRISTETGPVQHTAHAQLLAQRAARQQQAEQQIRDDPFVQTLMREFGATIVPGSIKPIPTEGETP